ncbi:MAG: DUF3810 domain-containing protein [Clostridia bacterium]|nr:DUF3810 domain-containing protein [Clostridia bacterium]
MTSSSPTPKRPFPRLCIAIYILAGISAGLYLTFTQSPAFSDWFNQGISHVGRHLLALTTCWLPFSVAELLLLLIPVAIVLLIVIACRYFCATRRDAAVFAGGLFAIPCVILILFVWNFAPGYYGSTLDQKLELKREKVSGEELYQTAELLSAELKVLIPQITFLADGSSLMPYSYEEMNDKLLEAYETYTEKQDFLGHFYSRVKPIMLSEPMSYTHITGIYTFFTGEANINVNFPDYTVPFTAAHELAHQRGIAREDEANFVAYLVCMESDDPYIRYSATLNLYEYVISALYSANKELYRASYADLPAEIRAEEVAYSIFFEKYKENVAADVSESVNNSYLQSQGAPAGSRSYNLVVDLAVAYYRPLFEGAGTSAP